MEEVGKVNNIDPIPFFQFQLPLFGGKNMIRNTNNSFYFLFFIFTFLVTYTNWLSAGTLSIKEELEKNYSITSIHLDENTGRPSGNFFISGDLTPKYSINIYGMVGKNDPLTLGRTFIMENPKLFGVTDFDQDFKVVKMAKDRFGNTHILYHRYMNEVRVDQIAIYLHINNENKIYYANGYIYPIKSDLITASRNNRAEYLTELDIQKIVELDLEENKGNLKFKKIEKIIDPSYDEIVWRVDVVIVKGLGRWIYLIDSSSGLVLKKEDALIDLNSH